MLAFSGGKDSVCAWLELRRHFSRVVPVFQWWCPDLSFINRSLAYYERFFETPIIRIPHPGFYDAMRLGLFQDPVSFQVVESWGFGAIDFREQMSAVAEDEGLDADWYATGISRYDSINRRLIVDKFGFADDRNRRLHVIGDWRKPDKIRALRATGVRLASDYCVMGRSWDGFEPRYIRALKKHWPDDLERMKRFFPLIEASIWRDEVANAGPR